VTQKTDTDHGTTGPIDPERRCETCRYNRDVALDCELTDVPAYVRWQEGSCFRYERRDDAKR
jgi:hypothetical protein